MCSPQLQAGAGERRRAGARERTRGAAHGVALRSLPPAAHGAAGARSARARWSVKQQVVPLNTARDIDTVRRRAGGRRAPLRVSTAALNGRRAAWRARCAAVRAGAVLRDERRREARRAVVRADGRGAGVRRRRARASTPTQIVPAPLDYELDRDRRGASPQRRSRDAGPRQRCTLRPLSCCASRATGAAARAPVRRVGPRALPRRRRRSRRRAASRRALGHRAARRRRAGGGRSQRAHLERVPRRARRRSTAPAPAGRSCPLTNSKPERSTWPAADRTPT